MSRDPYILKEEEIDILFNGLIDHGEEETYERMKAKVVTSMFLKDDADDMLMDMHDTIIKRARDTDDDKKVQEILYHLATILRRLAHETYFSYIKMGKKRNNKRFLRLVK